MGSDKLRRLARRLIVGVAAVVALIGLFVGPGSAGSPPAPGEDAKCSDFATQGAAQRYFRDRLWGEGVHTQHMDRGFDGLACESLRCPCFRNGAGVGLRVEPRVGGRRDPIIVSFRASRRLPTRRGGWYSAEVFDYPKRCFHDLHEYDEDSRARRGETVSLKLRGATTARYPAPWCLGRHWVLVELCTETYADDCVGGKDIALRSFRIVRRPPSCARRRSPAGPAPTPARAAR